MEKEKSRSATLIWRNLGPRPSAKKKSKFTQIRAKKTLRIALQNMTITIGNTDCHLLLDSGSGCTIINMSLAREMMLNCAQSQWSEKKPLELKSFSDDIDETLETLKKPVRCNGWKIQKAKITVVADGFRPILGQDFC